MKKITIIAVLVVLIGVGAWVFLGGEKGVKENGVLPEEKAESLTEILGKAKNIVSYRYDAVMTIPDQPVMTTSFWLKENKMRWEGSFEGQSVVYLIDKDELVAYLYMPSQNMAMKMNYSEVQETVGESMLEQSGSIEKYNPINLGTEILNGKSCLVVEHAIEAEKAKMWIWKEYGFPIRTEITTPKGMIVTEIKNIKFGDILDSVFELPAGVQIMEMPIFDL